MAERKEYYSLRTVSSYDDIRASLNDTIREEGGYLQFMKNRYRGGLDKKELAVIIRADEFTPLEALVNAAEQIFAAAHPSSLAIIRWWAGENGLVEEVVFVNSNVGSIVIVDKVFSDKPSGEPPHQGSSGSRSK